MRLMTKRRQSRANRVEVSRPIDGVVVRASVPVTAPLRPGDTAVKGAERGAGPARRAGERIPGV